MEKRKEDEKGEVLQDWRELNFGDYLYSSELYVLRKLLLASPSSIVGLGDFISAWDTSSDKPAEEFMKLNNNIDAIVAYLANSVSNQKRIDRIFIFDIMKFLAILDKHKGINLIASSSSLPPYIPNFDKKDLHIIRDLYGPHLSKTFLSEINREKISFWLNSYLDFLKAEKPKSIFDIGALRDEICTIARSKDFLSYVFQQRFKSLGHETIILDWEMLSDYKLAYPTFKNLAMKHLNDMKRSASISPADYYYHIWYAPPRVPVIEALLLMEREGAIDICSMSFAKIIIGIKDMSLVESVEKFDAKVNTKNNGAMAIPPEKRPEIKIHKGKETASFEYGSQSWSHKAGRKKILRELMQYPQYENFENHVTRKGKSSSITHLATVGGFTIEEREKKEIKSAAEWRRYTSTTSDRTVRDAIQDIRDKMKEKILEENKRIGLPIDYMPAEIRAVDNSYLLVIKKEVQ